MFFISILETYLQIFKLNNAILGLTHPPLSSAEGPRKE